VTSIVNPGTADEAVRIALQHELHLPSPLNTNIHKNDQMLDFSAAARGTTSIARSDYFTSGAELLSVLEQLARWKFGSFENVASFLDFAGGYGRLTRFLVQKLPADRIWVSDIQADAVAFQEAEFGVHGFVSASDPAHLACDQTFDCIFVASLFSHLPPNTFLPWLKTLHSLLRPGGLLIFSVHGESSLPAGNRMPDSGIWFDQTSEIPSIDTKEYGVTVVSEAFVRNAILEAIGQPVYKRIERGLLYQQDLYLVANEPAPDFSNLRFKYAPHGGVDYALWSAPGELRLRGWAADITAHGTPVEVQIIVDEQFQQSCAPSAYRPDLLAHDKDDRFSNAGWECSCHLPGVDSTQVIVIKSVSSSGTESILYAGTVGSLLPVGRVDLCAWTGPSELYLKGWIAGSDADGSPAEVHIFVNGRLRQKCLPSIHRPDLREHFQDDRFLYAGWACSCHIPEGEPPPLLDIVSVSPRGENTLLYSGSIDSLLPLTSLDTVVTTSEFDERLRQLKSELSQRLEYIRHLEAEVSHKNEALAALDAKARRWPWQRRSAKG
jgi:SAM-dependent methyltransferase